VDDEGVMARWVLKYVYAVELDDNTDAAAAGGNPPAKAQHVEVLKVRKK